VVSPHLRYPRLIGGSLTQTTGSAFIDTSFSVDGEIAVDAATIAVKRSEWHRAAEGNLAGVEGASIDDAHTSGKELGFDSADWIPPLEIRSAARTRTKLKNSAGLDSDGAWSDGARSAVCKRFEEEKAGRVLNVEDTVDVDTRSGLDAMCTINKADDTGLGIQEVGVVMVAEPNSWIILTVVA
jgi:hypothetical protein